MKSFDVIVNGRRMRGYVVLLILGLTLIFAGIQMALQEARYELSDAEIIERAKALGMVELKDTLSGPSEEAIQGETERPSEDALDSKLREEKP